MTGARTTRFATTLPGAAWSGRTAVISPHLDDAAFSLGASIRAATRRGIEVDVVTVLAGDPSSTAPGDGRARWPGFATEGEAAVARREEDRTACAHLGATPVWLALRDDGAEDRDLQTLRDTLTDAFASYDAVLLPAFPLAHRDHRLVSALALEILPGGCTVGLYVEQPYASWNALARVPRPRGTQRRDASSALGLGADLRWTRHVGRPADWVAKTRAMDAYASQLAVLRRAPRARILAYEALHRGESVAWITLS